MRSKREQKRVTCVEKCWCRKKWMSSQSPFSNFHFGTFFKISSSRRMNSKTRQNCCFSQTDKTSNFFQAFRTHAWNCLCRPLPQTIFAKATGCQRTSRRHATTTNWCCPSSRASLTKWTSPSTFALCFPTRASTPCSWTRTPNW